MAVVGGITGYVMLSNEWDSQDKIGLQGGEKKLTGLYIQMNKSPNFGSSIKLSFTWILMYTNLVPISLIVSLELVKFF